MPTALFLSPHLDDAAFSAGATMAAFVDAGWRVVLATIFTRSMPGPTGFALRCQTDKGLPPDADYMAIRRAEDAAAARALGLDAADVHWLDLPEAPHRGYGSPAELFAGVRDDDAQASDAVADAARPLVSTADVVFTCATIGNHVDHLHVRAAVERLVAGRGVPLVRWHDAPYVLRLPEPPPADAARVPTAGELSRKLDACAAYATQLPFQFGGEPAMRDRLSDPDARIERFAWRPGPGPTAMLAELGGLPELPPTAINP